MITVSGLGSGLDIEGLVTQLVAAERVAPDRRIAFARAETQAELSAFGQLQGSLSNVQTAADRLNNPDLFQRMTASSSDTAVSVSVEAAAVANNYSLEVSQLAQAHAIASQAFTDGESIGNGTLSISFGRTALDPDDASYQGFSRNEQREVFSLEIDEDMDSLADISAAINEADAGVRAAVINDGSGQRLVLSSDHTGADNSLEITVTDADGEHTDGDGLSRLAYRAGAANMQQTVAARDAQFSINGLAISSATNTVDQALAGVELTLNQVTEQPVEVAIGRDVEAVTSAVNAFISSYNSAQRVLDAVSGYNAESSQGGVLQGDFTVSSVENRLRKSIGTAIDAGSGVERHLTDIGITTGEGGQLALDKSKLEAALDADLEGTISLLAAYGRPQDSRVEVMSHDDSIEPGSYAIQISQAASQGSYESAAVLPDFGAGQSLLIDASNDTFSIAIDDSDAVEISLTRGSYASGEALAREIEARVNGAPQIIENGRAIRVDFDADTGSLSLLSDQWGAESAVEITAASAGVVSSLGLQVRRGTDGTNVEGTINGEVATGAGRVLTAGSDSAAAGLALRVSGAESGDLGSIDFTHGIFSQLSTMLEDFLGEENQIDSRTEGLQSRLDNYTAQTEALDLRMDALEARYRQQFGTLDLLIAQMNSTSDYLAQQLANLPEPNSIGRN